MIKYDIKSKFKSITVVGDLPRIGETVVFSNDDGGVFTFKVVDIRHILQNTTDKNKLNGTPPEVYVEFIE